MSTEQKNPEVIKGGEPPEAKIANEDRAMLAEVWHDILATQNSMMAFKVLLEKLEVQKVLTETQHNLQNARLEQLKTEMEKRLEGVRVRYNLPDGATVDTKDGLVKLPDQAQQPAVGGPPMVQVQPGASPVEPTSATVVPAGTVPQPGIVAPTPEA